MDALHAELTRIATSVRGTVGVCAQHIERQHRIAYNADMRFPMASVFKLPVAVCLLTLVERRRRFLLSYQASSDQVERV